MKQAVVIYPHQLFESSPALTTVGTSVDVYLVEEPLILTHNPIHRQKLMFHKLSLDSYQTRLEESGHTVKRLKINEFKTTASVFERLHADEVNEMHITDTTDNLLEKAISKSGIERIWYESPLFILEKNEAVTRYQESNRFMAKFYKELRRDKNILMSGSDPVDGKWSFDEDNRKKIPKDTPLPDDIEVYENAETAAAAKWAESVQADKYGDSGYWLPYTHDNAKQYLEEFLLERFECFGPYEDAITTKNVRLWHSALSPLMNIGLLTPQQVVDEAISFAEKNKVPINSLEGFVRQIIGWREFIRASYECDGVKMRNSNHFDNQRMLPKSLWTGETNITPLDHTIKTALRYGYTHHIERLMVMGNFFLLTSTDPSEVYRWFMGMYLDAYDWVMVPNVYGMSQFADGGSFATKPYISGANYLKKMSDFEAGDWEDIWTALYWNFVSLHSDTFSKNHRLSMMPRMLEKMDEEKREKHFVTAKQFLENL